MALQPEELQVWFHYEEIAMHFNQLIIQYRLQLMGGAGAIGAIASYLIGGKVEDERQLRWLRFLVSGGLFILVFAAAILDVCYYNKLLQGAVDALMRFEAEHPELYMSTMIEQRVVDRGIPTIYTVYGLILVSMFGFTLWSGYEHFRNRTPAEKPPP